MENINPAQHKSFGMKTCQHVEVHNLHFTDIFVKIDDKVLHLTNDITRCPASIKM